MVGDRVRLIADGSEGEITFISRDGPVVVSWKTGIHGAVYLPEDLERVDELDSCD